MKLTILLSVCLILFTISFAVAGTPYLISSSLSQSPIRHIVVIMQENHTFDNYFGTYGHGSNGLNLHLGLPYCSPGELKSKCKGTQQFVKPWHLNTATVLQDLTHSWAPAHLAYDNGKMDGFLYAQDVSVVKYNYTMGYYKGSDIPYYWDWASEFVLADNYYSSIMSITYSNHLYFVGGTSDGIIANYPEIASTPDAPLINQEFPTNTDQVPFCGDIITNCQSTILSELSNAGRSWTWYATWGKDIMSVPVTFMANHYKGVDSFLKDIDRGELPAVSIISPNGPSEHPPGNITLGMLAVTAEIDAIAQSPYWANTAIFVTWDDYGGFYDHVAPPQIDQYGYGFRVPLLVISAYTPQGVIDHTLSDHTSLTKFIENTFGLQCLTPRDCAANNLFEAFNFKMNPRPPIILPGPFVPLHYPLEKSSTPQGVVPWQPQFNFQQANDPDS